MNSTVHLGFENKLWEMADKLRGNIESSEYKHVILGLVFLKYISDSFYERYHDLLKNYPGMEEERVSYEAENVLFQKKRVGNTSNLKLNFLQLVKSLTMRWYSLNVKMQV